MRPTIPAMDASTARTQNIRRIVAEHEGPTAFANRFGAGRWTQTQVSQWISVKAPKGIGHTLAREIEDALNLPAGSLDRPPESHAQRLDGATIRSALELARRSIRLRGMDDLDLTDALDLEILAAAINAVIAEAISSVSDSDVVRFATSLSRAESGADGKGNRKAGGPRSTAGAAEIRGENKAPRRRAR